MVAAFLTKCISQIFSGVFDVGEVDGPILLTGCPNCEESRVRISGTRNIVARSKKLVPDRPFQHGIKLWLVKRGLSLANLVYSRFINVYSYCPDTAGREGRRSAQANVAQSDYRDRGQFAFQAEDSHLSGTIKSGDLCAP